MREFEIKFQVPDAARAALHDELRRRGARSTRLVAVYFDTADGRLARHRVALRLRKEGPRWVQTLKASGGSALDRLEHNVPVRAAAGARPVLDIARHDGTEVGQRLREALGEAGPDALIERYATDVTRLAARLRWPGCEVEAAFDVGVVRAGARELPICELELEHLAGDRQALFELARLWRGAGGLWLDVRPKSQRGSQLVDGVLHGAPVRAGAPRLDPAMPGPALLRAVIGTVLAQVLPNASELAAGSTDEEHLHQLRVGLRRLRTALRELGPLAQDVDPDWEPALADAFARLGRIRDDETVARAVQALLERAGAPKLAWSVSVTEADAGAIVRDAPFQDTLLALLRWTEAAPDGVDGLEASESTARPDAGRRAARAEGADGGQGARGAGNVGGTEGREGTEGLEGTEPAGAARPDEGDDRRDGPAGAAAADARRVRAQVVRRLDTLHRQVVKAGRRFDALPTREQHRVRKRLKRLRYLAEFVASLWDGKAVQRYLKRLAPAQEALGHHNDIVVAEEKFRGDAQHDALSLFAAGFLRAHQAITARAARAALKEVAGARPFWRR